ncbi:hypothetical protein IHE31_10365 [Mycetohabitans rhizoxinica]|uniref:hypothetical protein n=1 Tax=Mycetohabitans rhizoxinica TaxID=412963 RepID=UPI0030D3D093
MTVYDRQRVAFLSQRWNWINKIEIRPIHTEQDYSEVLKAIAALVNVDSASNTLEGKQLEILLSFVEDYETSAFR